MLIAKFIFLLKSNYKKTINQKQTQTIEKFLTQNNHQTDIWIEKDMPKPTYKSLIKLLEPCKEYDIFVVADLSVLGKNLYVKQQVLSYCLDHKIDLWIAADSSFFSEKNVLKYVL